jgi:hypothetical protein
MLVAIVRDVQLRMTVVVNTFLRDCCGSAYADFECYTWTGTAQSTHGVTFCLHVLSIYRCVHKMRNIKPWQLHGFLDPTNICTSRGICGGSPLLDVVISVEVY